MVVSALAKKKISTADIKGERGVAHIRKVVSDMGFLFYETGGVEAGIDGSIELRDPETGEVANQIIQFQSKATAISLPGDTDFGFHWPCAEKDIEYWTFGTAPVILIVVDLNQDVAYWKDLRTWFSDPQNRSERKVHFNKQHDMFSLSAAAALQALALSARPGSYFAPPKRQELLTTNLLRVSALPKTIFWAPTQAKSTKQFWYLLRQHDRYPHREAILRSGAVLSFRNLDEHPWRELCDTGAIEEFQCAEWSETDDPDRERDFVHLLNLALQEKVSREMRFDPKRKAVFFKPNPRNKARKFAYFSEAKNTDRFVAKPYERKDGSVSFWRHSAFKWQFIRIADDWYVQITPTYHFTWNGRETDNLGAERLAKIKRMEWNNSVRGQFIAWREYLCEAQQDDLFSQGYPFLSFAPVDKLEAEFGIPDDLWNPAHKSPPDDEGLLL